MRPVTASIWIYFLPLFILAGLALLVGTFALLGRVRGGKYLRPVVQTMMRIPLLKRLLARASKAALERQNPELASAVRKMERFGSVTDPQKAQSALGRLTPQERRAWMDAVEQQAPATEAMNRQQRRRLERMQREGRRGGR
jgi:predicted LPLAT superfamily acyltransferase